MPFRLRVLMLWAAQFGVALAAHAQVSVKRLAPPGFEILQTRSVEQLIHFQGIPQPGMVLLVRSQMAQAVQAGDTVVVARATSKPLTGLLGQLGVHPRAARAWVDRAEFELGSSSCLPLKRSADCLPIWLDADEQGRVSLLTGEPRAPEARDGELALLGSAYASTSWAFQSKNSAGLRYGLSTQGMVSSRENYLEYDLLAGNTRQSGAITPNLLVWGTRLFSGAAAHAGLFRASGLGGEASATQFFVRPRLLGVAVRSEGRMLRPGEVAQVRITLLAPARVTISANGVQLYSALLGLGEQVISLPGLPGNFVDVQTEEMSGERQTFQAAVVGSEFSGGQADSWRFELGQTVANPGLAIASHKEGLLLTAVRAQPWKAFNWQAAMQLSSGGAARLGLSLVPHEGRWGGSVTVGHRGEFAFSGHASTRLLDVLEAGVNHLHYRAPTWNSGTATLPCSMDRTLCYASVSQERTSVQASWLNSRWPIHLSVSASRSGGLSSRQMLLRTSIPLNIGANRTHLQIGLRQMQPSGTRAVFAFLSFMLDATGTMVNSSLNAQDGRTDLGVGYSRRLDDVWGAPATISQGISGQFGTGSAPPSFHHQFSGRAGPIGAHLSASHGGQGSGVINAAGTAHYGFSRGRLAFTRYSPELGQSTLSPTTMAAVKFVNDSMDEQMVTLGMRTIAVPPQARLLIPTLVGHSPDVRVAPGPVEDAQGLAMPKYLHAGNIEEIRVRDGSWQRVRFMGSGPEASTLQGLKTTHVRRSLDGAEERIYQDAQGYAFVFEPAVQDTRLRYLDVHNSREVTRYRCEAPPPAPVLLAGIYPEVEFQCQVLASPPTASPPR
jgi:hypothetical protein